jgi:hypothetical protein
MNPLILKFTPSGEGSCLYSELIDLSSIGSLQIRRASRIEFNNQTQFWEVRNLKDRILYFSRSHAACLLWEHQHLNQ